MKLSIVMLAASVASASAGLGWWVHPGAGLLLAGCAGAGLSLLRDDGSDRS